MNDTIQLAYFEMMQRCLIPVDDDLPDPTVNFDAFCAAVADRTERIVYALPRAERHAYFVEKARGALAWCEANRAPDLLKRQARRWLAQLTAPGGNRHSSTGR